MSFFYLYRSCLDKFSIHTLIQEKKIEVKLNESSHVR